MLGDVEAQRARVNRRPWFLDRLGKDRTFPGRSRKLLPFVQIIVFYSVFDKCNDVRRTGVSSAERLLPPPARA